MKRIAIAFCLLCLFLALPVNAQEYDYCAGAGGAAPAGPSCTTADDSLISTQTEKDTTANFGGATWFAQGITLSATTMVTQIILSLEDVATADTNTIVVSIYNDSAGKPGTEVANTSVSVSETTFASSGNVLFTLATPQTLSAGNYHIVIRGLNESNSTAIGSHVFASGVVWNQSADSGSHWTSYATYGVWYQLYGCQ